MRAYKKFIIILITGFTFFLKNNIENLKSDLKQKKTAKLSKYLSKRILFVNIMLIYTTMRYKILSFKHIFV